MGTKGPGREEVRAASAKKRTLDGMTQATYRSPLEGCSQTSQSSLGGQSPWLPERGSEVAPQGAVSTAQDFWGHQSGRNWGLLWGALCCGIGFPVPPVAPSHLDSWILPDLCSLNSEHRLQTSGFTSLDPRAPVREMEVTAKGCSLWHSPGPSVLVGRGWTL